MSEKQLHSEESSSSLPPPNLSSSPKHTSTGKKIGFGLLSLLALWTIVPYLSQQGLDEVPIPSDGYLAGVADKGLRYALGPKDHKHKDKHHSHSPHKWVTPKAAEEIFVQVPNNSSARE